jgi:hypothetical protein
MCFVNVVAMIIYRYIDILIDLVGDSLIRSFFVIGWSFFHLSVCVLFVILCYTLSNETKEEKKTNRVFISSTLSVEFTKQK